MRSTKRSDRSVRIEKQDIKTSTQYVANGSDGAAGFKIIQKSTSSTNGRSFPVAPILSGSLDASALKLFKDDIFNNFIGAFGPLPSNVLLRGLSKNPQAMWDSVNFVAHVKKHGEAVTKLGQFIARSEISVSMPSFRDGVNGDIFRYDSAHRVLVVISKQHYIKTSHGREADSYYDLAWVNYWNKTKVSVAD